MNRWRVYTPFVCRVVIERTEFHSNPSFDGMSEKEVIESVKANILYRWPSADLRMTKHLGKTAIDVSRDGNFYYEEPEAPTFLYHVAQGC